MENKDGGVRLAAPATSRWRSFFKAGHEVNMAKHPAANGLTIFSADAAKRRARDKLIDEWIKENPEVFLHLEKLSKDELIHRIAMAEIGAAYDKVVAKMPKKRGRPPKTIRQQITKQVKQPLSDRHQNFGEKKIKWTTASNYFLVCLVEATKLKYNLTKDIDALLKIAEKIKQGKRAGIIREKAESLKPALSKARKSLAGKQDYDYGEGIRIVAMKWSQEGDM